MHQRQLCRNPFFYSGHFNFLEVADDILHNWGGRNPFFYSGHFNLILYGLKQKLSESQSLLLFRAFQQLSDAVAGKNSLTESRNPFFYSGHFNTQFGQRSCLILSSRNPFFYSGHFNHGDEHSAWKTQKPVAIPSFIQGISTRAEVCNWGVWCSASRNPFFYSGHFNTHKEIIRLFMSSGRNPFFYSGHFNKQIRKKSHKGGKDSRNPFFYSGHFNKEINIYLGRWFFTCRNPFFYSGHFNKSDRAWWKCSSCSVAIPSFIQGISTWGGDFLYKRI